MTSGSVDAHRQGDPCIGSIASTWARASRLIQPRRLARALGRRPDGHYVTFRSPFIPAAAWPGTVQRYSYVPFVLKV
jgi:hypothetical protein